MCYRSRLVAVILGPPCSNSEAGKLSGAFLIDESFHSYLRFKAKLRVNSLNDSEYNQFILREWEYGAKRSFSIANKKDCYPLHPPSRAYGTLDRLRHRDTLKISKCVLASLQYYTEMC